MAAEVPVVVIDNGSQNSKAGFSGDDSPKAVFTSVVGRPRYEAMRVFTKKDYYAGSDALAKRGILSLKYPIEHSVVTNWDDMEKLLEFTFRDQLQVDPGEHPVLLSEPPCNPRCNREKMTQVMFEKFKVPYLYEAVCAVLSLYNTGSITGAVVDSGQAVSYTVPVYEGHSIPHALGHTNFDLTYDMKTSLLNKAYNWMRDIDIVNNITETLGYVALDFDREMTSYNSQGTNSSDKSYELPDGEVIKIGDERFRVPEVMFQPSLKRHDCPGLHEILFRSINRCDVDIHKHLYGNITLNGGNTMFEGFVERLQKEITSLAPSEMNVKVNAHSGSKYPAWTGGSILASLPTFKEMCISKEEYDEYGPAIVHKKCF